MKEERKFSDLYLTLSLCLREFVDSVLREVKRIESENAQMREFINTLKNGGK